VVRLRVGPFAAQHGKKMESGQNNWKVSKAEGTAQSAVPARGRPQTQKDVFRPTGRATDEERTKMEGKWDRTARVLWPHALV
jgi:hypothetical protein